MWYIVWRDKFTSYSRDTGDGYYVSYKDKLVDNYSKNPLEAKKYKGIKSAINRLGLNMKNVSSVENFIKQNNKIINNSVKRDIKLKEVLNEELDLLSYIYTRGRIEILSEDGTIKDAKPEVIDYIKSIIGKNRCKRRNIAKLVPEINTKYKTASVEDFFN